MKPAPPKVQPNRGTPKVVYAHGQKLHVYGSGAKKKTVVVGKTSKPTRDQRKGGTSSKSTSKKTTKTTKTTTALPPFSAQVTPEQAKTEAAASTAVRYGQQESDLNDMVRESGVQQGKITNWFDQYKSDVDQTKAAQATYIQGQVAANTATAAQAGGQTQFAPGTDASVVAAEQQGAKNRESQVKTLGAAISAAGAAENNYLANRKNVGSAAQLGARLDESRSNDKTKRELTRLKGEKGDFQTSEYGKIRDRERQYGLESAALGVKTASAAADVADDKADNKRDDRNTRIKETSAQTTKRNADRKYQLDVKKFGAANAKDRYQRTHKTGPYKPGASKGSKPKDNAQTSAQRQAFHDDVGSSKAVVARLKGAGKDRHTAAMAIMSDPKNKGELATSIALDLAYDGAVSRANVKKAHEVGLAIGSLPTQSARLRKVKRAKNSGSARAPGGT